MDRSLASEEAQRWLGMAEKLLAARDLLGAKSFAIRVREAFPRLETAADDIVAVADTLTAAENRIGNSGQQHRDWYAVLGLPRFTNNLDVVANHYRRLALILNPDRNRLPYADEAFRLVTDSWSVLSNPSKRSIFHNELAVHSRYEFAAGAQPLTHSQTQNHTHLQEHQFLQRNNHQPQHQLQPQFHHQQHQHQTHQNHQHQLFNQNPPPPPPQFQPEPPPSHAHWQQQPQTQPQPQPQPQPQRPPQQQAQAATRTSPPNRNLAPIEDERPNLNNDAVRPPEISPPPPPPSPPTPLGPPSPEASPEREENPPLEPERPEGPTFWTACPYCYILYEYPKVYEDCVLRCQTCKRAFTAGPIPAPPIGPDGEPGPNYFCCWGFFPLGSSGKAEAGAAGPGWSPFSPMFTTPVQDNGTPGTGTGNGTTSGKEKRKRGDSPRVVYKDDYEDSDGDEFLIDISDDGDNESDSDWRKTRKSGGGRGKKSKASTYSSSTKRKAKKGSKNFGTPSSDRVTRTRQIQTQTQTQSQAVNGEKDKKRPAVRGVVLAAAAATAETGRKSKLAKKRGGADWGRLDLNVEFNNDSDEPAGAGKTVANRANGAGNKNGDAGSGEEDDNIEGIGFFEGLDEFLSSLPILNVVGDEKVKAAS